MNEFPLGWTKTLEQLVEESRQTRRPIPGQEFEWASAYERSLWPAGIRLPKEGDEYEALEDMEVGGLTHWFGAFTGGFRATLKKGTMIRVYGPISAQAVGVSAQPVNVPEFESTVVAETDRHSEKYAGFSLSIKVRTLHEKFRLVRSAND